MTKPRKPRKRKRQARESQASSPAAPMPKPAVDRALSRRVAWIVVAWCVPAVFVLFIGGWFVLDAAMRHFHYWLYADQYVPAELEVTRLDPRPMRRGQGLTIKGVIHPGGEQVQTNARDIAISQFVAPNERATRRVPLRGEIEGQRLAVLYWPEHPGVGEWNWWHPPTVIMPGATETGGAVVRNLLLGIALGGIGVFCLRRGYRYGKAAMPRTPEIPATPAWVGITLVLLYVGVLGLVAYFVSLP